MKKGVIFKYTDKNGAEVKGVTFNDEQVAAFKDHKKAFLRLLNDDLTFKINDEGKKLMGVVDFSRLTRIGFWD